jgi:hypothetical protein
VKITSMSTRVATRIGNTNPTKPWLTTPRKNPLTTPKMAQFTAQ